MSVLVGFVPTPEGRAALRRAVLECRLRGARLVVVHSVGDGAPADPPAAASVGLSTAAIGPAAEVGAVCQDLGIESPEVEVRRFEKPYEPADDMLDVAEETDAELIVIGLRRRSGAGKLILGSSAQRILLDASCPVLAVKTDVRASDRGLAGPAASGQQGEPAEVAAASTGQGAPAGQVLLGKNA